MIIPSHNDQDVWIDYWIDNEKGEKTGKIQRDRNMKPQRLALYDFER